MSNNEVKALMILRLLAPEHQDNFSTWVEVAYVAENSVRKLLGQDSEIDSKSQE